MVRTFHIRAAVWLLAVALAAAGCGSDGDRSEVAPSGECQLGGGADLDAIAAFLQARCYQADDWRGDPGIRPTGPTVDGVYYSVHGDVRVWYAPALIEWLHDGRPDAELPDGTIIVKEQYAGPGTPDPTALQGWTFMLRDRSASWDGWIWGYVDVADPSWNVGEPFLQYCVSCHASSDSRALTFASLRNLRGESDDFAHLPPGVLTRLTRSHGSFDDPYPAEKAAAAGALPDPLTSPRADFVALYDTIVPPAPASVLAIPDARFDHVPPAPEPRGFVTSDVCSGCHDADSLLHGVTPNMVVDRGGERLNLSPYGEWSASLMGLAGRDPVFRAQLESEWALHPEIADFVDNFCFTCHGVMGHRELATDTGGTELLTLADTYDTGAAPRAHYAALARDGVSCSACHRIASDGLGQPGTFTGQFAVGPPDEIYGPYDRPKAYAMENGLGVTPREGSWIKSSALCGSCHAVILPILDRDQSYTPATVAAAPTVHEQATYLEWQNSVYQNERAPIAAATARTCQDCHMPAHLDGEPLAFPIANIQDAGYPPFDHVAPAAEIDLPVRAPYARHTLVGANLFVMSMFQQFPDVLGIDVDDENLSSNERPLSSLLLAARESAALAQTRSARVTIAPVERVGATLEVTVTVENLAGHKLPSGVGFRRAFLELAVLDADGDVLWASGRTSPLGVIVDGNGAPLATELSTSDVQPHHAVITREDQAQIYETRHRDSRGGLTTSFLALADEVKDNRLLPRGWSPLGPSAEHTEPHAIDGDPRYLDGSGSDDVVYRVPIAAVSAAASVRATLYYQAIPPYYLADRFRTAGGPETQRLHFIGSRLAVEASAIENWKLRLAVAEAPVGAADTTASASDR